MIETVIIFITVISILSSTRLIYKHLTNYYNPRLQRHVVRLLFMVPIYSICCVLQVVFIQNALEIALLRDGYEGFVVFSFFYLVSQYVAEKDEDIKRVLQSKSRNIFPPPLCFWRNNPSTPFFYEWTRIGVLQYVITRISTTIIALIQDKIWNYTSIWIQVVNGLGMSVAMFTLVNFYIVIRQDISSYRPVLQFLSVKFVIFFGFWQGFLIKFLARMDVTVPLMQNLLVSVEMLVASAIHHIAFDPEIFRVDGDKTSFTRALVDSFNWLDLYHDFIFLSSFIKDATTFRANRLNTSLSDDWQDAPFIVVDEPLNQGLLDFRG